VGHAWAVAAFALALPGIMHEWPCWRGRVFWKGLSVWLPPLPRPDVWLGIAPGKHAPGAPAAFCCGGLALSKGPQLECEEALAFGVLAPTPASRAALPAWGSWPD